VKAALQWTIADGFLTRFQAGSSKIQSERDEPAARAIASMNNASGNKGGLAGHHKYNYPAGFRVMAGLSSKLRFPIKY
jgi:hypothetical protein